MEDFIKACAISELVTAIRVHETDFYDYNQHLNQLFRGLEEPQVKRWQIFGCNSREKEGDKLEMYFKSSNLPDATTPMHIIENNIGVGQHLAILSGTPKQMKAPGLREIKQVELYTKYRPLIPEKYRDGLCPQPSDKVMKSVKLDRKEKQNGKRKQNEELTSDQVISPKKRGSATTSGAVAQAHSVTLLPVVDDANHRLSSLEFNNQP